MFARIKASLSGILLVTAVFGSVFCYGAVGPLGDTELSVQLLNSTNRWESRSDKIGLSLAVSIPEGLVVSGKRLIGEIMIRNDSGKPIRVFVPGLHGRIRFVDSEGAPDLLPKNFEPIFARSAKGRNKIVELQPGEFIGRRFAYDNAHVGEFKIIASYAPDLSGAEYVLVIESPTLRVKGN